MIRTVKRPRLLFLQNSSIFEGYGGIEYYLDDVLTLMTDLGGPSAVAAVVPQRGRKSLLINGPYSVAVVPFSKSPFFQKLQNRFSLKYVREALRLVRAFKPDALVCGHVSLGPLTHLLHRLTGLPYLACAYGIDVWGGLSAPNEWALRRAYRIISISHWTKRILVERGYPSEKIVVIHPGLARGFEDELPPARREAVSSNPFRLLTVSRLDSREQYKGQDHTIEALQRLRKSEPQLKFHYVIQGEGTDRLRLEQLAKDRGVADIVEFRPGARDRKEFETAYRATDLYVMPSRYGFWDGRWRGEGFGIVYLEAAAFGIPSVAYDCGGATDIIKNAETGILVKPDDIGELARTLSFLARNPRRLAELGRNAFEAVMRDFTRPAIRAEIARALDSFDLGKTSTPVDSPQTRASLK